ncbi:MAG: cyclic nucleotide-binding domain-containing protein [Chloroflexota bacterium]
MTSLAQLDRYLPEEIRIQIEQRYLVRINQQARLEHIIHDPIFYQEPENYPPFYADHGVVHFRDVALQVLQVLSGVHGLLIPARESSRLEFMKGYGVVLAYIHDIGMADFSHFGRAMHPEVASQEVFSPGFEDILQAIWRENCGNLAWRLSGLANAGVLEQAPREVLREMLAMANCHSKSKVPIGVLNDPQQLRTAMQAHTGTPLKQLYRQKQIEQAQQALLTAQAQQDQVAMNRYARLLFEAEQAGQPKNGYNQDTPTPEIENDDPARRVRRSYTDFERDSFRWLLAPHELAHELVEDVIDTLRALRCADALRQRGTVLKTSGGYEIFVEQGSADAILALRMEENGKNRPALYLLEISETLSAGEANIAGSQIDRDGNLRIAFHRGAFNNPATTRRAAYNAAVVVNDIQADAIESFTSLAAENNHLTREIEILLEGVDDNLGFADLVRTELQRINPAAAARTRCVPSLQNAAQNEVERYLQAPALRWDAEARQQALQRIARSGHNTTDINLDLAFQEVKLVRLHAGEVLVEADAPSSFVYIPLGEGLRINPLGGYASFLVSPWMPLGLTGVIRGAPRNASVSAERDVAALMIPKEVYLKYWHKTHSAEGLKQHFAEQAAKAKVQEVTHLSKLERTVILQSVPLFAHIPETTLGELATAVQEVHFSAGEIIFEKGDPGNSMYVIVNGRVRVHDGENLLNRLGDGDVFGEMALLDPEARMASVTAEDETRLFQLEQDAFQTLMAEHCEVANGVIRVLLQRLRARAQDVAQLRSRLKGEESDQHSASDSA